MFRYREKLSRVKDLILPPILGSLSGYCLREGMNWALEGNRELSKSVYPNLDEVVRPVVVSTVYRWMNKLVLEIDKRVIGTNPIFRHYFVVRPPFIRHLFYTYPSALHTTIPKAMTLFACGLWELTQHLFHAVCA